MFDVVGSMVSIGVVAFVLGFVAGLVFGYITCLERHRR
jgi:hypothetical protein